MRVTTSYLSLHASAIRLVLVQCAGQRGKSGCKGMPSGGGHDLIRGDPERRAEAEVSVSFYIHELLEHKLHVYQIFGVFHHFIDVLVGAWNLVEEHL